MEPELLSVELQCDPGLVHVAEHHAEAAQAHRQLSDRAGVGVEGALELWVGEPIIQLRQSVLDLDLLSVDLHSLSGLIQFPEHHTKMPQAHRQVLDGAALGLVFERLPQGWVCDGLAQVGQGAAESDLLLDRFEGCSGLIGLEQHQTLVPQPHGQVSDDAPVCCDGMEQLRVRGLFLEVDQGVVEPDLLVVELERGPGSVYLPESLSQVPKPHGELLDGHGVDLDGATHLLIRGLFAQVGQGIVDADLLAMCLERILWTTHLLIDLTQAAQAIRYLPYGVGVIFDGAPQVLVCELLPGKPRGVCMNPTLPSPGSGAEDRAALMNEALVHVPEDKALARERYEVLFTDPGDQAPDTLSGTPLAWLERSGIR